MRQTITEQPKNELPRAKKGYNDLNYKHTDIENGLNTGWLYKLAFASPNVEISRFFEENGYEYEMFATWNPETRIMRTSEYCTNVHHHHLGSTCGVCGQVG